MAKFLSVGLANQEIKGPATPARRGGGGRQAENKGSVLGGFGVWPGLVDLN